MVTDPTEPELDLSWLEEMSATGEEQEIGAANFKAPDSSTQKEALLTLQGVPRAAVAARRTRFPTDNASNRNCRTQRLSQTVM